MSLGRVKLFLLILAVLSTSAAQALQVTGYMGSWNHTAVSGCCESAGTLFSYGAHVRLNAESLGTIDLAVMTNTRWSEGVILKPYYLIGAPSRHDTSAGEFVSSKTISDWSLVTSNGFGYYSHTATTKQFALPALTNGILLSSLNQLSYAFNKNWKATLVFQASYGVGKSDQSIMFGTFIGPTYEFDAP